MKVDSAIFYTNDIDKVLELYKDQVGLKVDYLHEGKFVSFIFEHGVRLGIKKAKEKREKPGHQTLIIGSEDIQSVYEDMKKKGITMNKPLTEEKWGIEFSFLDPDRNKIVFIKRK